MSSAVSAQLYMLSEGEKASGGGASTETRTPAEGGSQLSRESKGGTLTIKHYTAPKHLQKFSTQRDLRSW